MTNAFYFTLKVFFVLSGHVRKWFNKKVRLVSKSMARHMLRINNRNTRPNISKCKCNQAKNFLTFFFEKTEIERVSKSAV